MTPQQLLIPRYEVIADYPDSEFTVGSILSPYEIKEIEMWLSIMGKEWIDQKASMFSKYPHLFRRLHWWEERKIEEMPEYLKLSNGIVWKIEKYDFETNTLYRQGIGACPHSLSMWLFRSTPALESDYITFINREKDE